MTERITPRLVVYNITLKQGIHQVPTVLNVSAIDSHYTPNIYNRDTTDT